MTRYQRQRLWLISGALACLTVAALLLMVVFRDNIVFFYTPSECYAKPCPPGKSLRVGGLVDKGSVLKTVEAGIPKIRFTITDTKSSLRVVYEGLLPDLFREGQGVVVEGVFEKTPGLPAQFVAKTVLAKHDETYKPPVPGRLTETSKQALGKSLNP